MPRRKIGHIEKSPGGGWDVRVSRGYRADGKRRTVCEHVDGTYEDAEAACARIASQMGRSFSAGGSLTLRQYYEGVFRHGNSVRGEPRSNATLRDYDSQMRRFVLPALGDVPISRIRHEQVKQVVLSATSPKKCKVALRAVLNAAYDDGLIDEKPMTRRIATPQAHRPQLEPWSALEAVEALRRFEGHPLEAYLILGLSGLRLEESLGVTPRDVEPREAYDIVTGTVEHSLVVTVRNTYTDADGFKRGAKNDFSERSVPVIVAGRDRLLSIIAASRPDDPAALEAWAGERLLPYRSDNLAKMWRTALESMGLRRIPPNMLRHTSETLMQAARLPDTLVSRLHGHTELNTDYRHYMRPSLAEAERAAREVHKLMPGAE